MKKTLNRVLAVMLAAVMVLGGAPLSGLAGLTDWFKGLAVTASAEDIGGTCGDNLTWSLDTSTGALTISGTGEMDNYISSSLWYSYRASVKSVTMSDSVTSIGTCAFKWCDSLTSVTIPDSVTSIGEDAFYSCDSLTSITIPDSVTSIGYAAFSGCSGLTSITIPNSVTRIRDNTFSYCSSLTSVTIPDSVTSIGYCAFAWCNSITSITVDNTNQYYSSDSYGVLFNNGKTIIIQYPLGNKRTSYEIPDSVTSIGTCAFAGCNSLTSITVDSTNQHYSSDSCGVLFNNDKTSLIQYPIGNARTSYEIPDSVTSIGEQALYGCTSLTSVTIGDSVTSIGNRAFYNCTGLISIIIPDSVTSIDSYAFSDTAYYNNSSNWINNTVLYIGKHLIKAKDTINGNYIVKDGTICIADWAFAGCENLTSITIPDSVTSIGDRAFEDCDSLTSVTIPDSVTSIWNYAFFDCTSLTSITIPDSVTSIGESTFEGCTGLTSITIGNGVTSIGDWAFYYCFSLTDVYYSGNVSQWNAISIGSGNDCLTSAAIHFGGLSLLDGTCGDSLTWTLDASTGALTINGTGAMDDWDWDDQAPWYSYRSFVKSVTIEEDVTSIGESAFEECYSLISVTIGNGVTSIGHSAFYCCIGLISVTIGNGVTSIGGSAFLYCDSITSITIPDSVTSIGGSAFSDCDSLTSMTIPDSVTSIGSGAFSECDSLTSMTIPDSVTSIGDYAFENCYSLTSITVDGANQYYSSDSYGALFNIDKTILIQYPIGNIRTSYKIPDSVTSIESWAFNGCAGLTSITIPDSVTSIGFRAFGSCGSLTDVTIPDSVTSIGNYAFYDCDSLTNVTIPNSVTSIGGGTFSDCYKLTSVTIPDSVTSIGDSAFECCYSLTSITIQDSVTSIGAGAFSHCRSLTGVTIGNGVTSIGDSAFYYCTSLTSVTIGNSVTSIEHKAFDNCTSLTNVTIPDSVTSIGDSAFACCNSLTSITVENTNQHYQNDSYGVLFNKDKTILIQYPVGNTRTSYTIPNSVTRMDSSALENCSSLTSVTIGNSVTSIGNHAFYHCDNLTSVTIPDSVTSIEYNAFDDCTSLTDVYYSGSESQWNAISIDGDNESLTSATVHYNINPVTGVSLDEDAIELVINGTQQLTATVVPADATNKSVTWSSSNEAVATVDRTGLVNAKTAGTATITVTAKDTTNGTLSDTCLVTVSAVATTKIEIRTLPSKTSYYVGDTLNTTDMTLTATYNDGAKQTILSGFVCSPTTLNTVGTQTITVTYGGKSCTFEVSVSQVVVNTYAISYDANGGTGAPSTQTKTENIALILSSTVPVKAYTITYNANSGSVSPSSKSVSCTFSSWNTVQNGSGTSYAPGAGYTANANATLYARWTNPAAVTLATPVREGYGFAGWFTSASGGTQVTDSTIISSDTTVFARWNANSYTINFYDGVIPLGTKTLTYDQTGTLSYGSVPQKMGYNFVGWSITNGGPALFTDGQSVKNLTSENNGSVSYYAAWNVQANTTVLTDNVTGVELVFPDGAYDGDAQLSVEKVLSGTAFDIVENEEGLINPSVFNIKTTINGSAVQPNGAVQVKIPIPEGFDTAKCKLYYINTTAGTVEEIAFTVENGYIIFTTTHFSYWAFAEYVPQIHGVSLSSESISMLYKASSTLTASVEADDGAQYTTVWSSSDTDIVAVDQNGRLTATGTGTATITATVTDSESNTVSASCKVTVKYSLFQWILIIFLLGWIWY